MESNWSMRHKIGSTIVGANGVSMPMGSGDLLKTSYSIGDQGSVTHPERGVVKMPVRCKYCGWTGELEIPSVRRVLRRTLVKVVILCFAVWPMVASVGHADDTNHWTYTILNCFPLPLILILPALFCGGWLITMVFSPTLRHDLSLSEADQTHSIHLD